MNAETGEELDHEGNEFLQGQTALALLLSSSILTVLDCDQKDRLIGSRKVFTISLIIFPSYGHFESY